METLCAEEDSISGMGVIDADVAASLPHHEYPTSAASKTRKSKLFLWVLLFCICLGLGYPVLSRYDPSTQIPEIQDYLDLEMTGPPPGSTAHTDYRVLTPMLARPFYKILNGRAQTWNPALGGLMIADAIMCASTAFLLYLIACQMFDPTVALVSALLYLENFAVPNLRLIGMVDAAEGFFLLAIWWSLIRRRFWLLPLWAVLGAMNKETFAPFAAVLLVVWCLTEIESDSRRNMMVWSAAAVAAAFLTTTLLQYSIRGSLLMPWQFAAGLQLRTNYLLNLWGSIWDRHSAYVYAWLVPFGLLRIRRMPFAWISSTAAATIAAFALSTWYGADPGTMGRVVFSIAGPILTLGVAILLCEVLRIRPLEKVV